MKRDTTVVMLVLLLVIVIVVAIWTNLSSMYIVNAAMSCYKDEAPNIESASSIKYVATDSWKHCYIQWQHSKFYRIEKVFDTPEECMEHIKERLYINRWS